MPTFWALLILSFTSTHAQTAAGGFPREQIEKDLVLEATRTSPAIVQSGERVTLSLVLRNQSTTTAHAIVLPGDGSEIGWREPHVHYTATLDTGDGKPKPVPAVRYSRCGHFDAGWQKDARYLKPGEQWVLRDGLSVPSDMLEFQAAGLVRLRAHYSYRAGRIGKGFEQYGQQRASGIMAAVPAFEVISAPVVFEVVRPLDLVLTAKSPLQAETPVKLSDVLDLRLLNRSRQPVELSAAHDLRFEIEGESPGWRPRVADAGNPQGKQVTLMPNEHAPVLGASVNSVDGTWEYPVADTLRLRVTYDLPNGPLLSNWAEVKVVAP